MHTLLCDYWALPFRFAPVTVGSARATVLLTLPSTASSRNLLSVLLQCRRQELKVSGAKRKANARGSYSKFALLITGLQFVS